MPRWPLLIVAATPAMAIAQQAPTAPVADAAATPAPQQQPPQTDEPVSDEPDIIVRGTRGLPGAVIGDIPPE